MIFPRKWIIRRPGFLIPVFFLSFFPMKGQVFRPDAISAGLGSCFVSRSGEASASLNQAGLGRIDQNSCALHHARPFITSGLDILSLSLQFALKNGGPGLSFSTLGVPGMRQTSAWLSYGLRLHTRLYAGVGINIMNTSIEDEAFYLLGAGFALGFQFLVNDELIFGAHLATPEAWSSGTRASGQQSLMITSGFSYLFYETARFHSEFRVRTGKALQWCNGMEIKISENLSLLLGLNNQPWSFSAGISLSHKRWLIALAGSYCMDTGTTPQTTLSYDW